MIALEDNPAAEATTPGGPQGPASLGAQTGTTSLTAIRDIIVPDAEISVFEDTNAAKQAMMNDQVDAIVADLPERVLHHRGGDPDGLDHRPVPAEDADDQETFGMLFEKGSDLVACVDAALAELRVRRHPGRAAEGVALRRRSAFLSFSDSSRTLAAEPA